MDIRRGIVIGVLLTAGIALVGCTAESTDAEPTTSPQPSASSPAPTPTEDAATDEALLPMAPDEIQEWAETAVPAADTGPGAGMLSGWLSQHSTPRQFNKFQTLDAGTFQGQIACRGEGTITLSAGDLDSDPASGPIACTNETIAFDVTTTRTGMTVDLVLEGEPTVFAVSMQRVG